MKKYLLYLFTLLTVVSCEGPMGPPGPQGSANWNVINMYVTPAMWEPFYDSNNLFLYYRCIADVPELTQYIYNNGLCIVYRKVIDGNVEVQEPLAKIIYNEEGDGYLWEQSVVYDFSPGEIAFYVQSSDFGDESLTPPRMDFRVVLMW